MGKQGKLHSSPFHVESARYKYAIEHEVAPIKEAKVQCDHLNCNGQLCNLWNSGLQRCLPYKCKYHNRKSSNNSCEKCAYYVEGRCYHKSNPNEVSTINAAQYCCFYLSEAVNPIKHRNIQAEICEKLSNATITHLESSIQSSYKYIRYAKRQIASGNLSEDDISFYNQKISDKYVAIDYLDRELQEEKKKHNLPHH